MKPARREKILCYGEAKTGKSSAALSIARLYKMAGEQAKFWWIDTDDAVEAMLVGDNAELGIEPFPVYSWSEYLEASSKVMENVTPGDWIVIDMVDKAWKEVQHWYTTEVFGESFDEYMLRKKQQLRDAGKDGKKYALMLYEELDWGVINPQYDKFLKPLLLASKAHCFVITESRVVEDRTASKADQRDWGREGSKPTGQKGLPYQVHTVVHLERLVRGRLMTTFERVGREEVKNKEFSDFAADYLVGVGGWSLT